MYYPPGMEGAAVLPFQEVGHLSVQCVDEITKHTDCTHAIDSIHVSMMVINI